MIAKIVSVSLLILLGTASVLTAPPLIAFLWARNVTFEDGRLWPLLLFLYSFILIASPLETLEKWIGREEYRSRNMDGIIFVLRMGSLYGATAFLVVSMAVWGKIT